MPRNVIPVARTNASAASPAVSATSAPANAIARCEPVPLTRKPCMNASRPSHSDDEAAERRERGEGGATGQRRDRGHGEPAIQAARRSMSLVPVLRSTAPTDANSPALATLWAAI